jgi:phage baseplate assembly protein gpV
MGRTKLIVGVLGLMMAMMVAFAAPAMAQDRDFDRFGDGNNFEFDDVRNTLDAGGTTTTTCDQEVNQAAAAG